MVDAVNGEKVDAVLEKMAIVDVVNNQVRSKREATRIRLIEELKYKFWGI